MTEEELAARLLYRDGLMLVVDKPAGIAVHRGPKGGENLEDYFHTLRFGLPRNPALVHRLDRDTSGCLVLGRHHKALEKLGLLFKQCKIAKTYWAIVEGNPAQDEGLIDLPLKRVDPARGWWMKADPSGAPCANVLAGVGALGRACVFAACAADRAHAPASRSLRGAGLADPGGRHLWPWRRNGLAAACEGDQNSALQKQGRGKGRSAAAFTYARGAGRVWLNRRTRRAEATRGEATQNATALRASSRARPRICANF